jgi:hypothetical protein
VRYALQAQDRLERQLLVMDETGAVHFAVSASAASAIRPAPESCYSSHACRPGSMSWPAGEPGVASRCSRRCVCAVCTRAIRASVAADGDRRVRAGGSVLLMLTTSRPTRTVSASLMLLPSSSPEYASVSTWKNAG